MTPFWYTAALATFDGPAYSVTNALPPARSRRGSRGPWPRSSLLGDARRADAASSIDLDEPASDGRASAGNYFGAKGLVSLAANEAGGNAFVTEYAGPSKVASAAVYQNGVIDLNLLKSAMTPPAYVQQLVSMGLAGDPLMIGLLDKYIPMPDAVEEDGRHRRAVLRQHRHVLEPVRLPAVRPRGPHRRDLDGDRRAAHQGANVIDAHPVLTRLNTFIHPRR